MDTEKTGLGSWLLLGGMTGAAMLIHGYHGTAEDAEIYLPGVLKRLNPALFPFNSRFFDSHAGLTLFPDLVSGSIRLLHLSTGVVVLMLHVASIFALLYACLRIARLYFRERHAAWCGVALVASLLTLPVAGTALYIMDQYLTSRSFSTAASMLALACFLERKWTAAAAWMVFTAAVHPLMSLFLLVLLAILALSELQWQPAQAVFAAFSFALFPPVTHTYQTVIQSHPYFLLTNWAWYEVVGMLAPILLFAGMAFAGRGSRFAHMGRLLKALIAFEVFFLAGSLLISVPGSLERFAEIQPMRCLLLVYILLFLLGGCLLGEVVLRRRVWLWALLFVPLCGGMAFAQLQLFPASRHVELPWQDSRNSWVEGFDWIRTHTPQNAYFALDPNYEQLPGEDIHGFRAIAQRSMLADNGKDSGAVSMFPALAAAWSEQVEARRGWKQFQEPDFLRLKTRYGVDWVVLQQPGSRGLVCPYRNDRVLVCRVE
ncbi:MAG TPA: hypothetical protein VG456_21145 [Candidatus Sulfopaludibacter sp.]|jgi:hypothetical protein|nr:hypothetical protein [Candidatus Sulfopaludibacter sp.]